MIVAMNRYYPYLLVVALLVSVPVSEAFECPILTVQEPQGAANIVYGRGLLWEVRAPSGAVSHLFGTIHLADSRVADVPEPVLATLRESRTFTMEVVLDIATLLEMAAVMYTDKNHAIAALADPELFARTRELLARYGLNENDASRLKAWAAFTTLSLPPQQTTLPLDMQLLSLAQQASIPVHGLETLAEQTAIFESFSDTEQVQMLAEIVCNYDLFQADIERVIELYQQRDLASMARLAARYESELQERLSDALLIQRNQRMVDRMEKRFVRGGDFVAVGALHLPGDTGVLAELERRGYAVSAKY